VPVSTLGPLGRPGHLTGGDKKISKVRIGFKGDRKKCEGRAGEWLERTTTDWIVQ
jgi:hypothetical protein